MVATLLRQEVERRERGLYEIARAVEADEELTKEMAEWEITSSDGIVDETW